MRGTATIMAMGTSVVGGGASSLLTGLNVYYKLEGLTEEVGGLTLTNTNTVTFGTGKVNNAATFVAASSQYLSRADNAAFQMGTGTDFTLACWGKSTSSGAFQPMAIYGKPPGAAIGYGLQFDNGGITAWMGFNSSSNQATAANHTFNDGNWHLAIATFNRAGFMTTYIDDTLEATVSIAAHNGEQTNSALGFAVGTYGDHANFFDGSVDEVGIWNRIISSGERTTLWNSGAGTTYPF